MESTPAAPVVGVVVVRPVVAAVDVVVGVAAPEMHHTLHTGADSATCSATLEPACSATSAGSRTGQWHKPRLHRLRRAPWRSIPVALLALAVGVASGGSGRRTVKTFVMYRMVIGQWGRPLVVS